MSERSSLMRYKVEYEKRNSISTSSHELFCLLYKHTNDDVFDGFPKISNHFPKISADFPKLFQRPDGHFRTFSEHFRTFSEDHRRLPKIAEADQRGSEDVSIIHQQI